MERYKELPKELISLDTKVSKPESVDHEVWLFDPETGIRIVESIPDFDDWR